VSTLNRAEIGIVVDAGPRLGYGHAVRCIRLARALSPRNGVVFYPLSEQCKEFIESCGFETVGSNVQSSGPPPLMPVFRRQGGGPSSGDRSLTGVMAFPPLVITDLREAHGITASIRRHGSRHISIHDLGLAQCQSHVAIDGSITRLFPYPADKSRDLFLGPQYMITREPVTRKKPDNTVLVTFGGGATARYAQTACQLLRSIGLVPVVTRGFTVGEDYERRAAEREAVLPPPNHGAAMIQTDAEFAHTMANCRFAISGSGVTLYDLLASGVPTIAVAFDRIQLRTADAFHELGAVLSAGILERLSPPLLLRHCREMIENHSLVQRITDAGQMLVDGKGLSRVVDIVRRQLWLTSQMKTFSGY